MSDAPLIEESSLEERRAFIKDVFTFFTFLYRKNTEQMTFLFKNNVEQMTFL